MRHKKVPGYGTVFLDGFYQNDLLGYLPKAPVGLLACDAMQWKVEGSFLQGNRATGQLTQRHKPGAQPRSWPTFAILFSGT